MFSSMQLQILINTSNKKIITIDEKKEKLTQTNRVNLFNSCIFLSLSLVCDRRKDVKRSSEILKKKLRYIKKNKIIKL